MGVLCFALAVLALPFKSKLRLEAENAVLRHQLIVLRRRVRGRAQPTNNDRLSNLRRWSGGIGPAFAATGVGGRAHREGDRRSTRSCAR